MTFADIPAGSSIFLDANALVYHFAPHPTMGAACSALLQQIQRQQLVGFTSTHVLSEVAHRLMTFEAATRLGWLHSKVPQRLRQNRAEIKKLTAFRQAVDEIPNFGIQVLTVAPNLVSEAAALSQEFGLLSNDALIVAVMRVYGLVNLASHDADFDGVPGVMRYRPS
jgi:predicted nucleic acid-binding protein